MQKHLITIGALLVLLTPAAKSAGNEAKSRLLRLPGAMLLVGYPPQNLFVTTESKTWDLGGNRIRRWVSPSISSDGTILASVHPTAEGPSRGLFISTYSMKEQKWTIHKEIVVASGSVAISPDGSEIACEADPSKESPGLRIFNIKTGKVTVRNTTKSTRSIFSWSPDSKRILLSGNLESSVGKKVLPVVPTIYALDLATESVSKIASGVTASWAPSGRWIAIVSPSGPTYNQYRVSLIRPDGTQIREVMEFQSEVNPILKPVWSPDSQTLLLNVSRDPDTNTWDIYQVDIETLKHTKLLTSTSFPVYGWVALTP